MTKKEKKDKILTTAEMYKELDEKDKIFINGYLTGKREERAKWERKPAQEGEMQIILISILTAAITTKIIATYYFKKIDGYVEKMCEMTLKSNEKTVAIILHKLQENFELED